MLSYGAATNLPALPLLADKTHHSLLENFWMEILSVLYRDYIRFHDLNTTYFFVITSKQIVIWKCCNLQIVSATLAMMSALPRVVL